MLFRNIIVVVVAEAVGILRRAVPDYGGVPSALTLSLRIVALLAHGILHWGSIIAMNAATPAGARLPTQPTQHQHQQVSESVRPHAEAYSAGRRRQT